jgi:hypothetical protein
MLAAHICFYYLETILVRLAYNGFGLCVRAVGLALALDGMTQNPCYASVIFLIFF